MKCLLCDINPAMRRAWEQVLPRWPTLVSVCKVVSGDITSLMVEAVVSPANSHGYMRGGVDAVYTRMFGPGVEERLRALIAELPGKELPVGQALVVPTNHPRIPWLISAPTMREPGSRCHDQPVCDATMAAMKAALERGFSSVAFPGMGTGTGRLPLDEAARAMIRGIAESLPSEAEENGGE